MQIEIFDTYEQLSHRAAGMVADLIRRKPAAVLGLPTGSTPEGFYAVLRRSDVSLGQVRTFNLDEYVGLSRAHPESYYAFMRQHLFDHVDLQPAHIHIPDGFAPDLEAECRRYEADIRQAGGLDLVLLGLGLNGHIGFNEPGTPWDTRTRPVMLAEKTRAANSRFFDTMDEVPREALTMGIGTILEARQILLLAAGETKADMVRRALEGEPSVAVPASALQRHENVTVLLDLAAARLLRTCA
ncbi:MAG TPA: glucosamine-6-phosphate deaminase [Symbiobacteriaceae bacterium]|nr:glucosamine-6-phosphate deaminase [Symbiobacteriaceae bacterium]